ncbi:N-formylglutamate amidohydrolase [Hyphomicrobium sp.]|uniref:N-formylglutamate amidohydrolase n=1 Tax=Hyphomicrobium sp. TaxID=82 RepID=UPI002FDD8437
MSTRLQNRHAGENAVCASSSEAVVRMAGSLVPGLILLCDHAGNALPAGYGTLGLPPAELARHIAYDIGSAGVTRRLASELGVPAVMTRFSRLLIDCNRGEDDPTLIMRLSDGAVIPANRTLTDEERTKRVNRYYRPYHAAVAEVVDLALVRGIVPLLLSIHSFTPAWRGVARPWHAAVLWDKDPRLAEALLTALRTDGGLMVGDNEPYTGRLRGDCLWRHGTSRGLPHAILEIRQDLIASEAGEIEWAMRLAEVMRHILADAAVASASDLRAVRFYGSHTD